MTKKSSKRSRDSQNPERSYEVGYGRPPVATRFKPGQSGNSKGRRKGKRNLRTEVHDELQKLVVIREGDRTRKVTKQEALVTKLVNAALQGDHKAHKSLWDLMRGVGLVHEASAANPNEPVTQDDSALIAEFLKRHLPLESDGNASGEDK